MNVLYFSIGRCKVCGKPAWKECHECTQSFHGYSDNPCDVVYFCEKCAQLAHGKAAQRDGHKVQDIAADPGGVTELDLLSVICHEFNHYTCFTRSEDRWVFFDSMANRVSKS